MRIRSLEAGDVAAADRIRAPAFAPAFAGFRAAVEPEIAAVAFARAEAEQAALSASLTAEDAAGEALAAESADATPRLSGFICVTLDADSLLGEVALLAVEPTAQGAGVASALLEAGMARLRAAGLRAAAVGVGGDAAHAPARRVYEKAGFGPGVPSLWRYRTL